MLTTKTIREFIDELASNSPAPGGGSVSALTGALGAGLTSMVCRLTIGKKKYIAVQSEMESTLAKAEKLRSAFTELIDMDTEAFNAVMSAFSLPKESDEQLRYRTTAIQIATQGATLVPLQVMRRCAEAFVLIKIVAEKGNTNSISDAGVAAFMMHSACMGAKMNVQINLGSLTDSSFVEHTKTSMNEIADSVEALFQDILGTVNTSLMV
jgi:methenyltetrahydrofolate cyclohydrolase